MNSHTDVLYRPACPFCRGQGAANEVTMRNYQRTITYVCSTCMKTWTATDHVPLDLMREERQPSRGSSKAMTRTNTTWRQIDQPENA
jgi:hypothetical protein